MSKHAPPTGLPIHPECSVVEGALLGECSCVEKYDYVSNVERGVEVAERLEGRRNPNPAMGHGPDGDDNESTDNLRDVPKSDFVNESGFFKDSENLRCKAGLDFKAGPMNYDRFKSGSWAFAQETAA